MGFTQFRNIIQNIKNQVCFCIFSISFHEQMMMFTKGQGPLVPIYRIAQKCWLRSCLYIHVLHRAHSLATCGIMWGTVSMSISNSCDGIGNIPNTCLEE